MQEIGYSNKGQATKILGEIKDYINEEEARKILDKIGDTKMTASNKQRILNAQNILGGKKYLEFTNKLEEKEKKVITKKVGTGGVKGEPPKRTEVEELNKYKELVAKLAKRNQSLEAEIVELKTEIIALNLGNMALEKEKA
ncbi:MAG: hypothetical protein ACRC0G_02025 [Fusobacteriaceae bacterium]